MFSISLFIHDYTNSSLVNRAHLVSVLPLYNLLDSFSCYAVMLLNYKLASSTFISLSYAIKKKPCLLQYNLLFCFRLSRNYSVARIVQQLSSQVEGLLLRVTYKPESERHSIKSSLHLTKKGTGSFHFQTILFGRVPFVNGSSLPSILGLKTNKGNS